MLSEQSGGDPFDNAPLPDRGFMASRASGQPARSGTWVAGQQVDGILAHDHPEVILGLGEKTVGIDQFEADRRGERVPFVDVTVNEHRAVIVMGGLAASCAHQRVLDRCFAARMIQLLPFAGDPLRECSGLGCAGRQLVTGGRRQTPLGGRAENFGSLGIDVVRVW